MSAKLDLIYENFIYHVELITPTLRDDVLFKYIDPLSKERTQNTGGFRKFTLFFHGTGEQEILTSGIDRDATLTATLNVGYPVVMGGINRRYRDIITLMSSDRHDLVKCLRDGAKFDGYSDAYPTTDVGLYFRKRTSDEILDSDESGNDQTLLLSLKFSCWMHEMEI